MTTINIGVCHFSRVDLSENDVLLVEQNIPLALRVADRGYALRVGRIVLEGDIEEFKASEIVKRAYLGG